MNDCRTQAMMPKERRTCVTCAHCEPSERHCDSKASEYSWMVDVDDVDLPCGGYGYERRVDGLAERHERLAQVARRMYRIIATFESRFEADHYSPFEWVPERGAVTRSTREQLEELGVSVDD